MLATVLGMFLAKKKKVSSQLADFKTGFQVLGSVQPAPFFLRNLADCITCRKYTHICPFHKLPYACASGNMPIFAIFTLFTRKKEKDAWEADAIFTPFKEQNCLDMEENKRTRNYEVSQITLDPNSLLKIVIQTPLRK